jgi:hyperosmotically inducible protein
MKTLFVIAMASLSLVSFQSISAEARKSDTFEAGAKDAWITGKIETLYTLNRHLNPFSINTDVDNGMVRLSGTVDSSIDRDLAGELAKGVDGVVDVKNELKIDQKAAQVASTKAANHDGDRSFGVWVDDVTTTAAVKSKLIADPNTQGIKIDVDTRGDVVTLSGRVSSAEEKQLAEQIALNTGDVKNVRNQLVVDPIAH